MEDFLGDQKKLSGAVDGGGNMAQPKGAVKNPFEDWSQLVNTCFKTVAGLELF